MQDIGLSIQTKQMLNGLDTNFLFHLKSLNQCDQMARLFVQYLAIYNNVNLPKSIKIYE